MALAGKVRYTEKLPGRDQSRVLNPPAVADLSYALSLDGTAIKTGTWEYNNSGYQNAHAWSIGYDSTLATAIWIGPKHGDGTPLVDGNGATIWGSGLPTQILRKVLADVHTQLGLTPAPFPPPAYIGSLNPPGSVPN